MAARQRPQPAGPRALTGSPDAKRKAAVILEALCGMRTTQSASDELGVALVRYYVLETRMMQAMIDALEPKARGRQRSANVEMAALRDDKQRLEREVLRLQAMYRVTQRAVGVRKQEQKKAAPKAGKPSKTRRVRRQPRGERVVAAIRSSAESAGFASAPATVQEAANTGGS